MKHKFVRSASLAVVAAGAILGAAGVASADPATVGDGDGNLRGNGQPATIDTPNELASAGPINGGPVGPWAIFCMKTDKPGDDYSLSDCVNGLPD